MAKRHSKSRPAKGPMPKYKAPQVELWELSPKVTHLTLSEVLRHLKKRDQEDLCYALIAWIKWGIQRPFTSPLMLMLFKSLIKLLEIKLPKQIV